MAPPQASSSFPAEAVRRTKTHPAPLGSTAGLSIAIACQPIKRRSTGIARCGSNVYSNKRLGTYVLRRTRGQTATDKLYTCCSLRSDIYVMFECLALPGDRKF